MSNRKALLGKKLGMSQVWDENGFFVPVTLVDVSTNVVTAVKTEESDGYKAVQLGYGAIDPTKVTKPLAGHFAKAGVTPRSPISSRKRNPMTAPTAALFGTCSLRMLARSFDELVLALRQAHVGAVAAF